MEPRMRATTMRGADLDVERIGEGPPILFVHGDVVGAAVTWRKQRPLAERWRLILPNRPGFGGSPPLERGDFEVEAPMFAELLGDGAHLVGHSYGAVIALLAAAERPEAVRSLTVSEPGALRLAAGTPVVDTMIANGKRLYADPGAIPTETFLRLFRTGAGSSQATPDELSEELAQGVELLKAERPPWEADVPLERLASAGFPALVISGDHSPAFEAVCDSLATSLSAERAVIPGRGHTIPATEAPYNERLEAFLTAAEAPLARRRSSTPRLS
jgi:pimeloyl-ACP methyl ester carboxylesterase